jgi:predicted esterase
MTADARECHLTTVRRARYYLAGGEGASDVWIVLHGYGQLAEAFVRAFAHVAGPDRLIVAPEALNRFYLEPGTGGSRADARVGATWMTREDREQEIRDIVDYLDAVHARVAASARRVTALGFSQGAAAATRWVARGTTRVDRLVLWAGELPPEIDVTHLGERLPGGVVLVEGSTDTYGAWVNRAGTAERLAAAGVPVESIAFEGGHRLDGEVLSRLAGA